MVSIVIPIYNMECYIGEVLDSLLVQTYQNFEILCIDNGSTDKTPSLLEAYSKRDERIKVLSTGPSNAGAARNVGYKASKGEYLLFLDADDVFSPTLIENLLLGLTASCADLSVCRYLSFKEGAPCPSLETGIKQGRLLLEPACTTNLFKRWVGWAWDKMFTRKFIEKYQLTFQEIPSSNDLAFTYSALSLAKQVYEVEAPLIAHRYHAGSIETKRYKTPFCCVDALREYRERMRALQRFKECPRLEKYFKYYVARFLFWNLYTIQNKDAYQLLKKALPTIAIEFNTLYTWQWWKYKMLCMLGRLIRRSMP